MAGSLLECLLNISSSITTVHKRFSFAFFSFFKYVTLLKSVKKLFVECKMRATKSDSVMSAEKLEMVLVYGENYASAKIGNVS